jgi:hypothetical protein
MPAKKKAATKAAKPAKKRSRAMANTYDEEQTQPPAPQPKTAKQPPVTQQQDETDPPTVEQLQTEIDTIWATLDQHGIRPSAPAPPPTGTQSEPGEWGVLALPMDGETDTTVALENAPESAVGAGTVLQIDSEYMTVTDGSDPNNLVVERGTPASTITPHPANSSVGIGVTFATDQAAVVVSAVSKK